MSPEAPSPMSQPLHSPQAGSPVNGQVNGYSTSNPVRPGSMPPPQQPAIKKEDRDGDFNSLRDNPLSAGTPTGTQPPLASPTNPQTSFTSGQASFNSNDTTLRPGSSSGMAPTGTQFAVSHDEREKRDHERQDWAEARFAQHELWDPFLYGATLNDKIKAVSARSNLVEPQSGVLVNTQKNQPPPRVRVNGLEGATRVIDQGQSILDTKEKAERLNELVKLLSLSTKARIAGLVQAAARLALERRQHSQGRVPSDWSDVAVVPKPAENETQDVSSPAPSAGIKRSYDQAHSDSGSHASPRGPKHPAVAAFDKVSSRDQKAEQARQAKRRKRNEIKTAQEDEAQAQAEADAVAAALDSEKKTTKKERKMAESRVSEQQQHASTNEAARMATANLLGRFGAGKKKNYSWMTGGGSRTPSAAPTPTRSTSVAAVPKDKAPQVQKGSQLGRFDENSDAGIQARDLLYVLGTDGRAARSFVKGSSVVDDMPPKVDS